MKNCLTIRSITPIWLVLCLCLSFAVSCQKPPVKINLISDRVSYGPEDPIKMQIRVFNDNINALGEKKPVIARQSFFFQDFHLRLTIIDPKGMPVAKRYSESVIEPAPPYRIGDRFLVPVEIIPPDGENVYVMNNARKYYYLGETYGWYTADVRAPLETFSHYKTGPAGEHYAVLFAKGGKAYDPLASNKIRFEIAPPKSPAKSTLKAHVNLLTIVGGSKPRVSQSALENADVRLYRVSEIPPDYQPVSWKLYGIIWNNVKPQQSRQTDSNGGAVFSGVSRDDYLILARHPVFSDVNLTGNLVIKDDLAWRAGKAVECFLSVIRKSDGTLVPGKAVRSKISDLMITEPEYVEWDGAQETYPFIFESIGDWQVTTSVAPPEGFEADQKSLSAEVINEMEAVQFTITDEGSSWKETKVTYKIKHKKKTTTIKTKIGVKLDKKFAKEKGIGVYGHTPSPGPFKGGKKVGHQKQEKKK